MLNKRILIVDDEADFCLIMKSFFVKKGYEVLLAPTLREGIEKAHSLLPDILFMDNNLPDGNGWDAVDDIVEKIPHLRAYLVSAHRNKNTYEKKKGNIVIWEKPISMAILNEAFGNAEQPQTLQTDNM